MAMTNIPSSPLESNEDKKARVQEQFSRTAEGYVASFSHKTGKDLQRLIELGEWNDGKTQRTALDVATGGGHTALTVAPYVTEVTVSDITPRMLEQAKAFILAQGIMNAKFALADAEQMPFTAESFDCVTCRIAAHHFPHVLRFVEEAARVLKPGGLLFLIDCMAPSDPELDAFDNKIEAWRDPSHGRSCTQEEWLAFCTQVGLRAEHVETFRRTHHYDDWTARSQMPTEEKIRLEHFMLHSNERIQRYFDFVIRPNEQLESFSNDFILLKARKPA